jgi:uncharacterized protein
MEDPDHAVPLPAYSYFPGCAWPHPNRSSGGHVKKDLAGGGLRSPVDKRWWSTKFLRGVELFNAGYYWEAHEVWEELWHVERRQGPTAEVLKALIKLAAAGVKVREGRENGVRTHCHRAAASFAAAAGQGGPRQLGLDLDFWARCCEELAENPPKDHGPAGAPVTRVFAFRIEPESSDPSCESELGSTSATTC